jgi:hypothetical protein
VGSLDIKNAIESGYFFGWARYRTAIIPTFSKKTGHPVPFVQASLETPGGDLMVGKS